MLCNLSAGSGQVFSFGNVSASPTWQRVIVLLGLEINMEVLSVSHVKNGPPGPSAPNLDTTSISSRNIPTVSVTQLRVGSRIHLQPRAATCIQ
jgi:hypothetical protein